LQQVLVNLLLNARDATQAGGNIAVRATQTGTHVIIRIEDDGQGMDEATVKTIFDPFYTTKEPGKGRGLGLYVSYQLVHDARGELQASSSPGKGSCFTLTLPKTSGDRI
jgi:signal transduction histidine kinase